MSPEMIEAAGNVDKMAKLQMYFNEIPYGSTAYGIEAASQRYFGKSFTSSSFAWHRFELDFW